MSEFDATEKARKVFNEDYADSTGIVQQSFERAIGTDSLGPTRDITYLNKLSWRTTSRELPLFATNAKQTTVFLSTMSNRVKISKLGINLV